MGGGHKSGEWQVADKVFTGRLRLLATREDCKIVLEDNSGVEFAVCPVPAGERVQSVEPVTDSSRYFVLRLLDPTVPTRKAFVGLGFTDRSEAFDFNVALSDHEKHTQRAKESAKAAQMAASIGPNEAAARLRTDAASLYKSNDLSLKEGETIKVNIKRPTGTSGFMSNNNYLSAPKAQPQGHLPTSKLLQPATSHAQPPQVSQDLLGITPLDSTASASETKDADADNWATF